MHKAIGTHILIRIDKVKQQARSIISDAGLIVAGQYEHRAYKLQYGEIVSRGEAVKEPLIQEGMLAIVHDNVEVDLRKVMSRVENASNPEVMDEIRVVKTEVMTTAYDMYGVMNEAGEIFPLREFVFCRDEPDPRDGDIESVVVGMPGLPDYHVDAKKKGSLYVPAIEQPKDKEMVLKTKVRFVHPEEPVLRPGDFILTNDYERYPITLMGEDYLIIPREEVLVKLYDETPVKK